jgi:DNA ligase-1
MFKVGSGLTDADRKNPPKMGATITFGYFEITKNGVPRHPTFKRVRRI